MKLILHNLTTVTCTDWLYISEYYSTTFRQSLEAVNVCENKQGETTKILIQL